MKSNNVNDLNQILDTKQTLNNFHENQVEKKNKLIKQFFSENVPKSKKLLAWGTQKQQAERFIHKVKDPETSEMHHKLKDIQNSFEAYYSRLYTQTPAAESAAVFKFFNIFRFTIYRDRAK